MSKGNLSFRGHTARTPLRIDPQDPCAVGVCDGCSFWVNHRDLQKHMVYRGGATPVWDGMLFCAKCMDVPNPAPQFSVMRLPPDPVPVLNPRPETPVVAESGYAYWVDSNGDFVNTLDDDDTWGGEFVQTLSNWEMTQ